MTSTIQRRNPNKTSSLPQADERRTPLRQYITLARWGSMAFIAIAVIFLVVVQIVQADKVRPNVAAFGVDLGGMTREEARAALREAERERTGQELEIVDSEGSWTAEASDLGLVMDVDGAVDDAFDSGRTGVGISHIAALWFLRPDTHDVSDGHVAVSTTEAESYLSTFIDDINRPRIDPRLEILDDGTPGYVSAQMGREVQVEETIQRIVAALSEGEETVELAVTDDPPALEDEDFDQARAQLDRALDAPIEVRAGDETWTFTPQQLAASMTLVQPTESSEAQVEINTEWISSVVSEIGRTIDHQPQSPRVWWDGDGSLYVQREPQNGQEVDVEPANQALADAFLGHTDSNALELPVKTIEAPPVPEDLNSLGLDSLIAESSTPYGDSIEERKHNIEHAAELLNGTLVMPGQMFSFNSEIGPMTEEAGFKVAYGIASDQGELKTIPTEAGGICQVSTTLFQPVFSAGYQIEQRSTHSYWIGSYEYNGMVGLDSTVDPAAGLDLKWINNSDHAVLVHAEADGEDFRVRLIGRSPDWDVEIEDPEIDNVDPADEEAVHYEPDSSLDPGKTLRIERAMDGFDVKIVRRVTTPDGEERVWDVTVTYGKSRNVVLVGSEDGELPEGFEPPG
ncbi:MAG: VanW family protein [Chloroflexota bacterium]